MLIRHLNPILQSQRLQVLTAFSRHLNLQEYQSKQLLKDYGLNIQRFFTATSAEEAEKGLNTFNAREYVIKAQILAGGRGKGSFSSGLKGGVKLTRNRKEVVDIVRQMVGYNLTTKQTKPEGVPVKTVMIAEALDINREAYLAILMDRDKSGPVVVASPAGGMDIEEVAEKSPHLIFKEHVDINKGLNKQTAQNLARKLKFEGKALDQATDQIMKLYDLFLRVDATQVEINPFGLTPDMEVVCFDAKLNFDDSAQFRQEKIFALDDFSETDPREKDATQHHLNYIGMDGNIACLVNGAGLAMATMDIIKLHGGEPANFLDVGGNVKEDQVAQAFRILTSDDRVKAILVNIFGGIVNCATIANGLTAAFRKLQLKVPLVVRLEGTNVDNARKILKESALPIITASNLDDAAKKAVSCIGR